MPDRAVLCIAYFFPPVAVTGSHRTRAVVRHLPAFGWRPVVVTADDRLFGRDSALLAGLPEDLKVYRTRAPRLVSKAAAVKDFLRKLLRPAAHAKAPSEVKVHAIAPEEAKPRGWTDWLSWWLQVPDIGLGWLPWGLAAACRAAYRHRCRAIYSSAPYFTTHVIAMLTRRLTGLPLVTDFRDPWRASPGRKFPYRDVDAHDRRLERAVVAHSDLVICNTEPVRRDFRQRFPRGADKFVTVPNGFEPEDYAELPAQRNVDADRIVITHAGEFYYRRRPDPLFQALQLVTDREPALGRRFLVQLLGSPVCDGTPLAEIASRFGVGDQVRVMGEVPHRQALELLRGSDIQLLVGFKGAGADLQIPAKLFEYFGIGKPVLGLATPDSAIAEVMSRSGLPGEVCDPDRPSEIAGALTRLAQNRQHLNGHAATVDMPPALLQFTRREQVRRIASLLDQLVEGGKR